MNSNATVRVETVMIPTYGIGKPDKNPMFLEKRVYQGSSGKVYPLPVVDKILDEKEEKPYTAVFLENDYLQVMVLPELGGRIQRALDKTNGYDFVYYNEVIKPALVGLTGPWISGGIEFNWPQHHRPTTFAPVDWRTVENEDGSCAIEISEVDQMYGTKGKMTITLRPDRAYIEITGQLYNRISLPQTFLWWANPAVSVNDNTQSVFPPDVTAVYDHGKRDVSSFPIATGTYYKHDYSAGVDISRYKNIPVPTSYMCAHSDYDFVGGYDYGVQAGILHVADHHVSPGKKQWTWGNGDFGRAWDRNLTDENGPYIELMTGMFCDNQPDFTWLMPFEEKKFTQYFMPYKKLGYVKNACTECAVNLTVSAAGGEATPADGQISQAAGQAMQAAGQTPPADSRASLAAGQVSCEESRASLAVYSTGAREVEVVLLAGGKAVFSEKAAVDPAHVFEKTVALPAGVKETDLTLMVLDESGEVLLSYTPQEKREEPIPEPMPAAKRPEEIDTVEELYLTGLHLEQYRHATFLPEDYYLEGLRRDPGDIRTNSAYAMLCLRRGRFESAEHYARCAIERLISRNPNPYDSEAYRILGLALLYQGKDDEAYDAFYKATWSAHEQEIGFYYLACIDCRRGDYLLAREHIERSLVKNSRNLKARALSGMILAELGLSRAAAKRLEENLEVDAFDYTSRIESGDIAGALSFMKGRLSSFIECAIDYAEAGFYEKAVQILACCPDESPMVRYYEAYYASRFDEELMHEALLAAAERSPLYCFPNRLEDILVLQFAAERNVGDARAPYYLGCLWYDRRQYEAAIACWEKSAELDPSFPTVWRNLSLAYFNKRGDRDAALTCMEKAYALDESDARILLELDQLYDKLRRDPLWRIEFLESHLDTMLVRDDLVTRYAALLNDAGRFTDALEILKNRRFHPWEGGEGKATSQYALALTELGRQALLKGDAALARELLTSALTFPENLGEGKLEGAKDNNIYYYLGLAERMLSEGQGTSGEEQDVSGATASEENPGVHADMFAAYAYLERAAVGDEEPAGMMYYNDQPADMILYQGLANRALGREEQAKARFMKLINYGEEHHDDVVKIDYFAVSLPDLQLFEDDLSLRNRAHCEYLIALGSLGLGDTERAAAAFEAVLAIDPAHSGAILHRRLLR